MLSDKKIVALGDSITYGFPYDNQESWFNIAANELGFEHVNQGINGDSTIWMYCRFQEDVLSHKPTHVIIMGGTNDAYCDQPLETVVGNIERMLKMAQTNGIKPILGIPIPCDELYAEQLLQEYRVWMRKYAKTHDIEVMDFYSIMCDERGQIPQGLHMDGLHPNVDGYARMSKFAISRLKDILAQ